MNEYQQLVRGQHSTVHSQINASVSRHVLWTWTKYTFYQGCLYEL